ncbi:hypothetical protein [Streptomyces sp. NBC_01614]|uniref:Uncharacterized protein n=1 Tax=Streptomyces sp. NBC_00180 TaxID=2903632 RepID=A0AAU1IBU2_9ACTN
MQSAEQQPVTRGRRPQWSVPASAGPESPAQWHRVLTLLADTSEPVLDGRTGAGHTARARDGAL